MQLRKPAPAFRASVGGKAAEITPLPTQGSETCSYMLYVGTSLALYSKIHHKNSIEDT